MRVIQAFAQEESSLARFEALNHANREANIRAVSLNFIFNPSVEFLSMIATAIVLWFGGVAVAPRSVDPRRHGRLPLLRLALL